MDASACVAEVNKENVVAGPHGAAVPGCSGSCEWQPVLRVNVQDTPTACPTAWNPVSCPSRLQQLQQGSPPRHGAGSFDPFAPQEEPPGCTPVCSQQGSQPVAPPAVHRKLAADCSPLAVAPPAVQFADRIQSCPPERVGRRGTRPLLRVRVKRSLNGAVAAAAAAGPPMLARRSLDGTGAGALAPVPQPLQQLAGCSRKRFEADLVSPPVPRKSSRTLEDHQAADMMARLRLADQTARGGSGGSAGAQWAGALHMMPPPASGPPRA